MAKTTIGRIGFGQVEPNHLSMQRTGQMHAMLPANKDIKLLENGQFAKYDIPNGEVNFTGVGEWYMVFNEVKLYGDAYNETYKDYAMRIENFSTKLPQWQMPEDVMVPRLVKLNIGDLYTTNCVGGPGSYRAEYKGNSVEVEVGNKMTPNAQGYLEVTEDADYELTVVKVYNMADGQPAVKLMRTK